MNNKYQSLFALLEKPEPVIAGVASSVTLRPYQVAAVDGVYREWEIGHRSTLVCLPTGTGKSVVFSEVMRRYNGGRILVLAHREELIYQAAAHAKRAGLSVGVEMGTSRSRSEDVIVSSIQTQMAISKCRQCRGEGCDVCNGKGKVRRLWRFNPRDFGLVIVDEGHHGTSKSYRTVLHWYQANPNLRVLLVTATPERSDGVGLHNVVDSVAHEATLKDMIFEGWLCPIRQRFVTVDRLDLSRVKTKMGGDFADGDLERAMLGGDDQSEESEQEMLHAIAKPTIDQANGRPVLLFAAGVDHANKLAGACNAYDGVTAEVVIGTTDKDERKRIVERYKSGETQILVGVGCFTEGFDAPDTEVVSIARPVSAKALSLYLQMIGRGTRPLAGCVDGLETAEERRAAIAASDKPACIVLDFVGNSGRHKLSSVADALAGEDVEDVDLDAAIAEAKHADQPVDIEELIEKLKAARERKEAEEDDRKRKLIAASSHRADHAEYQAQDVDLFGGGKFQCLENYDPGPSDASPKQVKYLIKLGIKPDTAMSYSKRQAGKVIDSITARSGGDFVMPFGKHAGKKIRDLPGGYLRWAAENIRADKFQAALREFRNPQPVAAALDDAPF